MRSAPLAAMIVLVTAVPASAGVARLAYVGDACAEDAMKARVVAVAGRDLFVESAPRMIVVRVQATDAGVTANVSTIDQRGQRPGSRALSAASCEALSDALAVVVAMAVDEPDEPAPAPTPQHEPDPIVVEEPTSAFDAIAGAAIDARSRPAAIVGARVRGERWSLGLELPFQTADTVTGARVSKHEFAVIPCVHHDELSACATAALGWYRGRGEGVAIVQTADLPFAEAGARIAYEHHAWDRFALRAYVDAQVSLTTDRFSVDGMAVWSSPRFGALAGVALLARIP